uniref:protein ACCELERATED CELL DEATH 6-like n=1 Tax=Erigeron canadensis TaxID=72917 RepID=UPI001CB955FA
KHHPLQTQVVIPISLPPVTTPKLPPPPTPNLPSLELLEGSRENYIKIGAKLYEASMKGNWEVAKGILDDRLELVRFAITKNYETPLHVAASAESNKSLELFVKELVERMDNEDLQLQNKNYQTALYLAAAAGNVKIAKIIVNKNKVVLNIPTNKGKMPLYIAALLAEREMVKYLYEQSNKMSGDFWTIENRSWVLHKCVESDMFDIALIIAKDCPEITNVKSLLTNVLVALAQKIDAFEGKKPHIILRIIKSIWPRHVEKDSDVVELLKVIWGKVAMLPMEEVDDIIRGPASEVTKEGIKTTVYKSRVLFLAANMGNTRFIIELIQSCPDLIWMVDDKGLSIFHMAVKHRQAKIYNLLHEIGSMKDRITRMKDKEGNNMLHLVGISAKPRRFQNVSGVALQMQRELLWFQEVERMVPSSYRQRRNEHNDTPRDIFKKKHADLLKNGEEWMKDTAAQCMVVGTLISTIVFAAAFTLPGGYDQDTGIPFFRQKPVLIVFVISDAISLIFSSTSVLMFLSILTSRYAEHDFLQSLPKKLMFGLGTLFLSIVTMMVAFSSSFLLLYHKNLKWVPIIIGSLAVLPVVLFAILQFRLLGDVFHSIYRSKYLFQPTNRILYY